MAAARPKTPESGDRTNIEHKFRARKQDLAPPANKTKRRFIDYYGVSSGFAV
jgi:hypothetical protein